MKIYDIHTHSFNSLDGGQTVNDLCLSAIKKGVSGVAITDHADTWFLKSSAAKDRIQKSINDTILAKEKFGDRLTILKGVEMAEYLFDKVGSDEILKLTDYDVIIGSVHSVKYKDYNDSYARIPFLRETESDEKIKGFLAEYFNKVLEMANITDFDVLAHLTCPLRYINGKYKRNISIKSNKEIIEEILKTIIKRNISLEVNASGIGSLLNETMPNVNIIKEYKNLGGKLITYASDAHITDNVANGFSEFCEILKDCGFDSYFYYENRTAHGVKL